VRLTKIGQDKVAGGASLFDAMASITRGYAESVDRMRFTGIRPDRPVLKGRP
jgi:hypothetical protein